MFWKIGLGSLATLALGVGMSVAAEGTGKDSGCGMAGCGMAGMNHEQRATAPTTAPATQPAKVYTCSMCPEVKSDKPGKCPKCGMNLQLKQDKDQPKQGATGHDGGHEHQH